MSTPNDNADKQLQQWLDSRAGDAIGENPYDKEDLAAYLTLFEALKEKPTVDIPLNFSANVVAHLEARRDRIIDFKWNLMLPLAIILFAGIAYLLLLYIDVNYANRMMQLLIRFKWHLAFVASCFFIIQYFDNRILKRMHPGKNLHSRINPAGEIIQH